MTVSRFQGHDECEQTGYDLRCRASSAQAQKKMCWACYWVKRHPLANPSERGDA